MSEASITRIYEELRDIRDNVNEINKEVASLHTTVTNGLKSTVNETKKRVDHLYEIFMPGCVMKDDLDEIFGNNQETKRWRVMALLNLAGMILIPLILYIASQFF